MISHCLWVCTQDANDNVVQHDGHTLAKRYAVLVYNVRLLYWTSMLWSIDTCENKVSADQYHVTISQAQVNLEPIEVICFVEVDSCQMYWFSIGLYM